MECARTSTVTAPSSLSHAAKGLSTLPTSRGAAVSGNKSLKCAGLALCVQESGSLDAALLFISVSGI